MGCAGSAQEGEAEDDDTGGAGLGEDCNIDQSTLAAIKKAGDDDCDDECIDIMRDKRTPEDIAASMRLALQDIEAAITELIRSFAQMDAAPDGGAEAAAAAAGAAAANKWERLDAILNASNRVKRTKQCELTSSSASSPASRSSNDDADVTVPSPEDDAETLKCTGADGECKQTGRYLYWKDVLFLCGKYQHARSLTIWAEKHSKSLPTSCSGDGCDKRVGVAARGGAVRAYIVGDNIFCSACSHARVMEDFLFPAKCNGDGCDADLAIVAELGAGGAVRAYLFDSELYCYPCHRERLAHLWWCTGNCGRGGPNPYNTRCALYRAKENAVVCEGCFAWRIHG